MGSTSSWLAITEPQQHFCEENASEQFESRIPPVMYRAVTPFLFLGGSPPGLDGVHQVKTAKEAVRVISSGGTAVLPQDAWGEAEKVLIVLSPRQAAKQMHFAKTGSLV